MQQYVQYCEWILTGDWDRVSTSKPRCSLGPKTHGLDLAFGGAKPSYQHHPRNGPGSLGAWYASAPGEGALWGSVLVGELPSLLIGTPPFGVQRGCRFPLGGPDPFRPVCWLVGLCEGSSPPWGLPIATLSQAGSAAVFFLCRNTMIGVLENPLCIQPTLKGLSGKVRLFKHGLANCLVPIVTRTFTSLGNLTWWCGINRDPLPIPGSASCCSRRSWPQTIPCCGDPPVYLRRSCYRKFPGDAPLPASRSPGPGGMTMGSSGFMGVGLLLGLVLLVGLGPVLYPSKTRVPLGPSGQGASLRDR